MPHQPELIPTESSPEQAARNAEREEYLEKLRQKLKDPAFRAIDGFPIAEDEAILALSDPPYYTACPNPFLPEIIEQWQKERSEFKAKPQNPELGTVNPEPATETPEPETENPEPVTLNWEPGTENYHREPFAADVSEGKNDPIYRAHSYHTKVPHKAIMRYILHYTEPGDIVFDGFCGTGMTGVAAQLCGDKKTVESLGFHVTDDGTCIPLSSSEFRVQSSELKAKTENPEPGTKNSESRTLNPELKTRNYPKLGPRKAVLCDLSPAATFIAYNYNTPVDVKAFEKEAKRILREVEEECGWMYETLHTDGKTKVRFDYTVWSEVFLCPECNSEIVFLDGAFNPKTKKISKDFPCPRCGADVNKRSLERYYITEFDPVLGKTVSNLKRIPVKIHYKIGRTKHQKSVDNADVELLEKVKALPPPPGLVADEIPFMHMTHQRAKMADQGVTHLHHFFLPRAQQVLSVLWKKTHSVDDKRLRNFLLFTVEQTIWGLSLLARYVPTHYSQVNQYLTGVYYIGSQISEVTPWYILDGKVKRLTRGFKKFAQQPKCVAVSNQSVSASTLTANSINYIFTDPPFGENIYYADLNYLIESWHDVRTNSEPEAIIDKAKQKKLLDYQELMRKAFQNYYRVLKSGRWMTVEFHNSHNAVWNAIQEAILSAGFVIADVRVLDKKQKSYRQVTAASAAKQDLVISAYKPRAEFEQQFLAEGGREAGAWEFVRQHLANLPPPDEKNGVIEVASERQGYLLYDRMVAFHIQRGFSVPLSAAEFYAGLRQKFPERDGMYFLPPQAAEYDRRRLTVERVEQLALFVNDEKSAIQWLQRELDSDTGSGPQTYQDLQPKFLRELHQARHEQLPELRDILEENFLQDDDERWFLPDPGKQEHLEQLRERSLLREFQEYAGGKGRLKVFRTEAVRAGFKRAWADKNYRLIIQVAERLPNSVLQEDPGLLMYYDNALMRAEQEPRQLGF